MFLVLAYLAFFRMNELSFEEFSNLSTSQDPFQMSIFLSYLFDAEQLRGKPKEKWSEIYEEFYVETKLIQPIERLKDESESLLAELQQRIDGRSKSNLGDSKKQLPTILRPFNITPQRPRPQSLPSTPSSVSFVS